MKRCWVLLDDDRFCCLFSESMSACPDKQLLWLCSCRLQPELLYSQRKQSVKLHTHFCFSPLPSPVIFSWLCAPVFLLQTELIYCSAFPKCIQTFQVMVFSHALQVPTVHEFRQCLLSTVSSCCCKVIQQGFLCHWLDKCFCHIPENFFLLLFQWFFFSPLWLSVMYKW